MCLLIEDFFKEFLHKVVDISPNFNNIDDIVRRYDDLMQARNFILHLQEQAIGLLESAERDIVTIIINNQTKKLTTAFTEFSY